MEILCYLGAFLAGMLIQVLCSNTSLESRMNKAHKLTRKIAPRVRQCWYCNPDIVPKGRHGFIIEYINYVSQTILINWYLTGDSEVKEIGWEHWFHFVKNHRFFLGEGSLKAVPLWKRILIVLNDPYGKLKCFK